jgi:hypothetical protein
MLKEMKGKEERGEKERGHSVTIAWETSSIKIQI